MAGPRVGVNRHANATGVDPRVEHRRDGCGLRRRQQRRVRFVVVGADRLARRGPRRLRAAGSRAERAARVRNRAPARRRGGAAEALGDPPGQGWIESTKTPVSARRPIRIVRPATRCAKLVRPERSATARSASSVIWFVTASAFAAKIASFTRPIASRAEPGRSAREADTLTVNATRSGLTSYWVRPT